MATSAGVPCRLATMANLVFLNDCLDVLNDMRFEDAELARVVRIRSYSSFVKAIWSCTSRIRTRRRCA
jgi:hypothetical protein